MDKTQELIGKTLPEGTGRDAVHVAVAPAVAGRELYPAQRVGIDKQGFASPLENPIGIVDPFLTHPIFEGSRFFVFLFPGTITSLRHVWTHPAFGDEGEQAKPTAPPPVRRDLVAESRAAIEKIAASLGLTYNALMGYAEDWQLHKEYTVQSGSEHWRDTFDDDMAATFWKHWAVVTGQTPRDATAQFFSCSC
jgi:hypothetical protein